MDSKMKAMEELMEHVEENEVTALSEDGDEYDSGDEVDDGEDDEDDDEEDDDDDDDEDNEEDEEDDDALDGGDDEEEKGGYGECGGDLTTTMKRSTGKSGCVDLEKGSRDSEEISGPSPGVSARGSVGLGTGFQHMDLSCSQRNNSQFFNGKRKRDGPSQNSERKKKNKVPAATKIADAVSRIASASEARLAAINSLIVPGTSIGEVIAELQNLECVVSDPDWHSRCCQLLMFKPAREVFVSLKGFEQRLLDWLKFAAYNPFPFMKM